LNAFAERFVRSVKEEALSRFILFGECSLRHVLTEYLAHYHKERPHQGKGNVILVNLLSGLSSARLVCHTRRMNTLSINGYKHHCIPVEIISHAVWLYFRFCLSYHDVEELLFARGVTMTYEAIHKWCRKFGQQYANQLRHRRSQPDDKWHLDKVILTINGERHYLWRAVD
jgi:Integrase core domain